MSRIALKKIDSDPMFAAYTRGFRDRIAGVLESGNPFELRTGTGDAWELAWGRANHDLNDHLPRPVTPKEETDPCDFNSGCDGMGTIRLFGRNGFFHSEIQCPSCTGKPPSPPTKDQTEKEGEE